MIAYIDSSVLVQAYLTDEDGHAAARSMLEDPEVISVTATWSRIEVSGALVRAGRAGRCNTPDLLRTLDVELADDGPVTLVGVAQDEAEEKALELVRAHGIRALDAWHLAVAALTLPDLVDPGEPSAFATRDASQANVAKSLGFEVI